MLAPEPLADGRQQLQAPRVLSRRGKMARGPAAGAQCAGSAPPASERAALRAPLFLLEPCPTHRRMSDAQRGHTDPVTRWVPPGQALPAAHPPTSLGKPRGPGPAPSALLDLGDA